MDTDYRQKIQERAFEIWEEEGRPADRDRDHWLQAEQEIMGASGADEDAEDLSAIAHEMRCRWLPAVLPRPKSLSPRSRRRRADVPAKLTWPVTVRKSERLPEP